MNETLKTHNRELRNHFYIKECPNYVSDSGKFISKLLLTLLTIMLHTPQSRFYLQQFLRSFHFICNQTLTVFVKFMHLTQKLCERYLYLLLFMLCLYIQISIVKKSTPRKSNYRRSHALSCSPDHLQTSL